MSTKKDKDLHNIGDYLNNFVYNQRVSWAKKKANDFAWAEQMADYYDYFYGTPHTNEKTTKYKMNYDLYNGRGDEAMKGYTSDIAPAEMQMEGITAGYEYIQHHDIISQIAKAMVGEQKQRPLHAIAVDSSRYSLNQRKRKRTELFQEYIKETIVNPIEQQVTGQYMQEMGIQDPFSLNPDEQMQMRSDIQQRTQAMTPKEIMSFLRKDYKTPEETQAQQLIDYLLKELDVKYITDEGFKHAVITGEEIYHIGVRHNEPFLELVNPQGFTYSAAPNTHFIEEGEWAKYEQMIKYSDLFNNYGDILLPKHLKKMDNLFHGTGGQERNALAHSNLVSVFSQLPDSVIDNVDQRTKEGQDFLKHFYQEFGSLSSAQSDLRHVHIVWKSLRKLKHIKREGPEGINTFWVDESYEYNEAKGDFEQKEVWVPEVWETTKIGTIDAIYLNKRPIPYQYKSVSNPFDVKLPYYGAQYSRLMGNAKNVSPIDLGKPWQYKFNIQMARLHEMEATDIGKVLLTTMNAKPAEWSWSKFFMMMKYGKIAPLDLGQDGINSFDAQFFKQIDLSNLDKIAGQLEYLQYLQTQVAIAMSYNPSRLGQISPYLSVTNNQQNIIQSSFQTEDIYSTHGKVVENVLNGLLKAARAAYKFNEPKKTFILDDMSIAELNLDWELLDRAELGIRISNSAEDYNNLEMVKQQAQAMIQNGLITLPQLIKLTWAKNGAQVLNIAEQAEEEMKAARQQQFQEQQALVEQQAKMQQELARQSMELELFKQERDHNNKLQVAALDATKFAKQMDIDNNKINDGIQRDMLKYAYEESRDSKDRKFEEKKLEVEKELKEKEIAAKKSQSSKKP